MTAKARAVSNAVPSGAVAALSLLDRLRAQRDRWLENPGFQRLCSAIPFTRRIAGREQRALFDLCAGFVYSQILAACVDLRLFDILRERPLPLTELAARMALSESATRTLLHAACSLRLVERRSGGTYGLGMLGAAMNGNPAIAAMIRHHAMLYRDLRDPVALLRGETQTELSQYWAYAGGDRRDDLTNGEVARYSELMAASQALIADDVLSAYPFARHRCLLDVGGGEGAFIAAAAKRHPQLRFKLFDLPAVARRAEARLRSDGFANRAEVFGGSFLSDPLPRGADVVSLVRVLHDHDDDAAIRLLRSVRDVLPEDGVVVIAEPFAQTRGAESVGAYFDFYLMAMGQGRPRAAREVCEMLGAAGFRAMRLRRTRRPLLTGVVTACRSNCK